MKKKFIILASALMTLFLTASSSFAVTRGIFDTTTRSGTTQPIYNCDQRGQTADLKINSVIFEKAEASTNPNVINYTYSVVISNTNGRVRSDNITLSAYLDQKTQTTFDDLKNIRSLSTTKVANRDETLNLSCEPGGNTYTVRNFTVPVGKQYDEGGLTFVVDSNYTLTEVDKSKDQPIFNSNNTLSYKFHQGFQYASLLEGSINNDVFTTIPRLGRDLTTEDNEGAKNQDAFDAKNYKFQVAVIENGPVSIINPRAEYLLEGNRIVTGFTNVSNLNQYTIKELIPLNESYSINVSEQPTFVFVLSTPNNAHIPLYGYSMFSTFDENAAVASPPANYLTVKRIGDLFENPEGNSGDINFEICNEGNSNAAIDSISFTEKLKKRELSEIQYQFTLNGKKIWEPIYSSTTWAGFQDNGHEIKLDGRKAYIEPNACMPLQVRVAEQQNIDFVGFDVANMEASMPVYAIAENQETYLINSDFYSEESTEGYKNTPIKMPFHVFGTILIFNETEGFHFGWDDNERFNIPHNGGGSYPIGRFTITTNANQSAYVGDLQFSTETTFPPEVETMTIEIFKKEIVPWYIKHTDAYFQESNFETDIQTIEVPTNGSFTIPVNQNLSNGEKLSVTIRIKLDLEAPGDLTLLFDGYDNETTNTNVQHSDSPMSWETIYYTNFPALDLPLSKITHFIASTVEEPDTPYLYFDASPQSTYQRWLSRYEFEAENFANIYLDARNMPYFEPITGDLTSIAPKIEVDSPLKVKVNGSFTLPVDIRMTEFHDQQKVTVFEDILPNDIIEIETGELSSEEQTWRRYQFQFDTYPGSELDFIKLAVEPITATYTDSEEQSTPVDVSTYDHFLNSYKIFEEIVNFSTFLFGRDKLYLTENANVPVPQFYFIDEIENEEITMNRTCFQAQGNLILEEFLYVHSSHGQQPFEAVLLEIWGDKIYLPVEAWGTTQATFKPTEPIKIYHGSDICLDLRVQSPTEVLPNTFFDLAGIKAVITNSNGLEAPVIIQNGQNLSQQNSIEGAEISFY